MPDLETGCLLHGFSLHHKPRLVVFPILILILYMKKTDLEINHLSQSHPARDLNSGELVLGGAASQRLKSHLFLNILAFILK